MRLHLDASLSALAGGVLRMAALFRTVLVLVAAMVSTRTLLAAPLARSRAARVRQLNPRVPAPHREGHIRWHALSGGR